MRLDKAKQFIFTQIFGKSKVEEQPVYITNYNVDASDALTTEAAIEVVLKKLVQTVQC